MKQGIAVGTKQCKNHNVYKNCFVASEAIDWLVANKRQVAREARGLREKPAAKSISRKKATEFCELLRQKGYIRHVHNRNKKFVDSDQVFFRFVKNYEGDT